VWRGYNGHVYFTPIQVQPQTTTSQMMPGAINPTMNIQARQSQNDDILARCLVQTQRLR
ncbi:unnamed protein product, partial [Rotaria sp. Silwood2]